MGYKSYTFVGMSQPVWLPDTIEVIIDIVPASIRNVRSNIRYTAQDRILWHETGNTAAGANALSERNYLHSGAGGRYVGYNFAVDDRRIIQLIPMNEVTWHAGVASWNQRSWGVENCVGSNLDRDKARQNVAHLMGAICAAKGWDVATAVLQHNVTYGKNCPAIIRGSGLWSSCINMAKVAKQNSVLAASGSTPVDPPAKPVYATPEPIPALDNVFKADGPAPIVTDGAGAKWIWTNSQFEATKDTARYQRADRASSPVGPVLTKGTRFNVAFITFFNDEWWGYTEWATRIAMADTVRLGPAQ